MPCCFVPLKIEISVIGAVFFFLPSVISWLIRRQAIMLKEIIFDVWQEVFFIFKVLIASLT